MYYFLLLVILLHTNGVKCISENTILENIGLCCDKNVRSETCDVWSMTMEQSPQTSECGDKLPVKDVLNMTNLASIKPCVFGDHVNGIFRLCESSTLKVCRPTEGKEHLFGWKPYSRHVLSFKEDDVDEHVYVKGDAYEYDELHVRVNNDARSQSYDEYEDIDENYKKKVNRPMGDRDYNYDYDKVQPILNDPRTESNRPNNEYKISSEYDKDIDGDSEYNNANENDEIQAMVKDVKSKNSNNKDEYDKMNPELRLESYRANENDDYNVDISARPISKQKRTALDDTLQPPSLLPSTDDVDDEDDDDDDRDSDDEPSSTYKSTSFKSVSVENGQYDEGEYDEDEVTERSQKGKELGGNKTSRPFVQYDRHKEKKKNETKIKEAKLNSFLPPDGKNNTKDKSRYKPKSQEILRTVLGLTLKANQQDPYRQKSTNKNGEKGAPEEVVVPEGMMIMIPTPVPLKREQFIADSDNGDYDYDQDEIISDIPVSVSTGIKSYCFAKEIIVTITYTHFMYKDFMQ